MLKTCFYTLFALLAFAGNSVLCRLALGDQKIDAASFTALRLLSGVVVLAMIFMLNTKSQRPQPQASDKTTSGSWIAAFMLFVYAAAFSLAYQSLDTGVGALILFAAVQLTMISASLLRKQKLQPLEWGGLFLACSGFVYLVLPGSERVSLGGASLMAGAGIAWAVYTLLGQQSKHPLADTRNNFVRTLPLVVLLLLAAWPQLEITPQGIWLAVLSGGIASGLGYSVWYMALKTLSTTQAAVVQLLVPVIAALGGVVFAGEMISLRFISASALILAGILSVSLGRRSAPP